MPPHPQFRRSIIAICIFLSLPIWASTVRNDIDYQQFRDFSENKGKFIAGAMNIPIYTKSGTLAGTMFKYAPMADLSSVSKNGVATLVHPQYIASVAHNSGYGDVSFGYQNLYPSFSYRLVARNNFANSFTNIYNDFHAPRLHKLVTEVVPSDLHNLGEDPNVYMDTNRFSEYIRVGSGAQYVGTSINDRIQISGAYAYLSGGNIPAFSSTKAKGLLFLQRELTTDFGPMPSLVEPGDSGSPLFAYDKTTKRWGMIAVGRGLTSGRLVYTMTKVPFIQQKVGNNYAGTIHNQEQGNILTWTPQGATSTIMGRNISLQVNLKNTDTNEDKENELVSFNNGKSVRFIGKDGVLVLANSLHQGAGALEFDNNFTVKGSNNNITWTGAGVIVSENSNVNWQIKNPAGDRLSKLGKGTLYVNGEGINEGDISVGDGKVILAQRADKTGKKRAFNTVEIVSGRPTVVLSDNQQVNANNIIFGFKGGRLDLNGNNITFNTIRNQDDGARIVNHNVQKAAEITLKGNGKIPESDITSSLTWGDWGAAGADIYEYINTHANNRTDYFRLKGNPTNYYPTNQRSNNDWEYLSSNKNEAVNKIFDHKMAQELVWGRWSEYGADIYEYINTHANNRTDYFRLKGNPTNYYPTNQRSNNDWEFLGSDKSEAVKKTLAYKNSAELNWGKWGQKGGDIYEYINTHANNRTDYFILKGNSSAYFPTNQSSTPDWEFLGSNKQEAVNKVLAKRYEQARYATFGGFLGETDLTRINGKLNVTYKPINANEHLLLSGGTALNGSFKVYDGTVVMSGRPTPHSYDFIQGVEVESEADWLNREFKADTFSVHNNGKLYFGRNVIKAEGNFVTNQRGLIQLGFIQGSPLCVRSDYNGNTYCTNTNGQLIREAYNSLPTLQAIGNATLNDKGHLVIGLAHLQGRIQGSKESKTTIDTGRWTMLGNSTLGSLSLKNNSNVYLSSSTNNGYHQLVINGNLDGLGKFYYRTNAADQKGDHITVNGIASGHFSLVVNNSGKEPDTISPLSLITLKNQAQTAQQVNISLQNGYVDLGTYRYILANRNQDYRLYSPLREAQLTAKDPAVAIAEAQALAQKYQAEVARLTKELQSKQNEKQRIDDQLAKAKQKAANQQTYINNLSWIRFIARAKARKQLVEIQRQVQGYEGLSQDISVAINALTKSLETARKQTEEANEFNSADFLAKQVLKKSEELCLATQSPAICEAIVEKTSFDESEFFTQAQGISRYANTALSELSSYVNSLLQVSRNSDREILTYRTEPLSVWYNVDYQRAQYGSDNYRSYKQNSTLTQLGIETALATAIRIGAVLSNANSRNEFDQANGSNKLKMAMIYAKAQSQNGWLASIEAGYGKSKNSLKVDGEESKFDRNTRVLGFNLAKHWVYNGWQLKPYVGAKFYRLSGVNYMLDGATVSVKPLSFSTYQAGIKIAKQLELVGVSLTPSFSTEYIDASRKILAVNTIEVNSNQLTQRFARHFKHELGMNIALNNWEIGTHLGLLKGNEMKKQRYAGLKVAYNW